ncbi:hypothetical protein CR513_36601, partial [Mucuna pruriens]
MAEEEDDDESFGDFTFASFPSQPLPSASNDTNPLDDDDWGDFMNHSNNHISKPFEPLGVSLDPTKKHVNDTNGAVVQADVTKSAKGAIPLSIFGEEEEEEEQSVSANVFSNGGSVKRGSDANGSVGISDLISSLYNQHPQMNSRNGPVSMSNVAAPNPANSNGSKLNSDEEENEDGWEFKSAEWETDVKAEVPKHDNGAIDVLDSSNGIPDKAGGWHLEFEFCPSSASQDHISPQPGSGSESNEIATGFTMFNQNFGELNSGSGSNQNLEAPKKADIYPTNMELLNFDSATPHGTIDSSLASESHHQSDEWNFGFNFNSSSVGEDSHSSESYFKTQNNQDDNNNNNASPTNINVDSDINLFKTRSAVEEIRTTHEKPITSSENRREALPLSIFGDETTNTNEHPVSQDLPPYTPTTPIKNNFNSPGSNLSINDLIWNLYNQAENTTSPKVTPKASENQIPSSPEVSGSSLVTGDDDFDDDFCDFKDASIGTRLTHESAQRTSFNHAPQVNENGLQSSPTILNSELTNGDDDFEDDSWDFKDAISGTRSQDQASTLDHKDSIDYLEFYSKLKDELCNSVLFHLQNLKKKQSAVALSGEDAKAKALQEEIQEFSKILCQDDMSIPNEYLSEDYSPRNVVFDELLPILKEPKFQPLESEYQLVSRLSTAEKDMKSAMELLKDTVSTLRILKLGSREEQSNYLTIWSKLALVCSQELKHGAYVWKQAVLQNVHNQILSNWKGSIDLKSLSDLLNECYSIWLASGLEEALLSISNQNNFGPDGISRELVESIKYIHELDEHALRSYVISGEQTTCQLSALPAGFIPGIRMYLQLSSFGHLPHRAPFMVKFGDMEWKALLRQARKLVGQSNKLRSSQEVTPANSVMSLTLQQVDSSIQLFMVTILSGEALEQ